MNIPLQTNFGNKPWALVSSLSLLALLHLPADFAIKTATAATPKHAVLLLHGMNSSYKTWNKLVNNSAGFDNRCPNSSAADFPRVKLTPNSEGVYCFRINFGAYDRGSLAVKGLDDKVCSETGGCSGDYSPYETLVRETISSMISIKKRLGQNTEIILLGHSRGGLIARTLLQTSSHAKNVVGLITTGTPHAGSPLGRYYDYLGKNCTPESNNNDIFDLGNCAQDWRFVNSILIQNVGGLDIKAPTIGFLAEGSQAIRRINAGIKHLPAIKMAQISYNGVAFGCLGGSPVDSQKSCGYDLFGFTGFRPSKKGLNAVLNGRSRGLLTGDGIVPVASQKMTVLKGWTLPVTNYLKGKRVHIAETEQILDLTNALKTQYKQLGWLR